MADDKTNYIFVFLEIFACEGGIQSYVKDIFQAYLSLPSAGTAEVFLLRDRPPSNHPFAGGNLKFRYLQTWPPILGRLRLAIALFLCLRRRPKLVICGHVYLTPLVRWLCKFWRIPYIAITYGKEVWEPLSPAAKTALRQAAAIWTISRYSRDRACAINGLDPQKMQILPCVVDGNIFTPGAKSPELLQRYNLQEAKVLLTVARLWSGDIYKGVDVTIRALKTIAAAFPEVNYLVIGRGDDQPRLARLAQELGVSDRVIFAGFVPSQDLVAHYRLADAYVMPSQEGFGIAYLEALACGIPVVSGDADGSADPLQDGRLGWRVPHRDPMAVAAACIEILSGQDPRCQGQWLRQECLALFSKDILAVKLQQYLQAFSP